MSTTAQSPPAEPQVEYRLECQQCEKWLQASTLMGALVRSDMHKRVHGHPMRIFVLRELSETDLRAYESKK